MSTFLNHLVQKLWVSACLLLSFDRLLYAGSGEFHLTPIVSVGEDAGAVTLTVDRDGATNLAATVEYATSDDFDVNDAFNIGFDATGVRFVSVAQAGVDYVATSGILRFAPGETNKTFQIPILDNGIVDGTRAATVALSNPTGAVLGTASTATLFISDNETPVLVDPTFRPPPGLGSAVAIQPDGRLLVSTASIETLTKPPASIGCGLIRLNADGSLDPSFKVDCGLGLNVQATAVQADGKIVAVTAAAAGDFEDLSLVRLNANGSLDPSFKQQWQSDFNVPPSVFIEPDGAILVFDGDVSRLNADGAIDARFHYQNEVFVQPEVMALQPDGKFLIGGSTSGGCPLVERFNADGSPDPQFQFPSATTADYNPIRMIFVRPDGKLIVAGSNLTTNGPLQTLVAQLNTDGSIDPAFQFPASQRGHPWTGALLPDGRFLMSFDLGFPVTPVYRFNADGSLDTTYPGATPGVRILAVQPDGLAIGSWAYTSLVRLLPAPADLREFTLSSNGDYSGPSNDFDYYHIVVAQTGRSLTVSVRRLGNTSDVATVDYNTRDGSAVAGIDYVPQSGTLSFAKFETVKQVVLPVIGKPTLQTEKIFSLVLFNPSPGTLLGVQSEAVFTIVPPQILNVSYTPAASGGALHFTLTPVVPGVEYELQGSPDPTFHFVESYQNKVASDPGSLEFEETMPAGQPQRFYRANRVR